MSWRDFPCKLWTGYTDDGGYGTRRSDGKVQKVHRLAWIEANGPVPPETPLVLHHCDVRHCYEIEHLWVGTHADNMADMIAKGRAREQKKTRCPNGHPYDVVWSKGRCCRVCKAEQSRKSMMRLRQRQRAARRVGA